MGKAEDFMRQTGATVEQIVSGAKQALRNAVNDAVEEFENIYNRKPTFLYLDDDWRKALDVMTGGRCVQYAGMDIVYYPVENEGREVGIHACDALFKTKDEMLDYKIREATRGYGPRFR